MALNKEYFDAINIEVVKKKYYNANKVNAVFEDIRNQAEVLIAENEALKSGGSSKNEIADAIISARYIAQQIIADAKNEADEMVRNARRERDEILAAAQTKQDSSVAAMSRLVNNVRAQQQAAIDAINSEWQAYLCSLSDDYAPEVKEAVPADLHQKVGAIAKEMFSLDD